MKMILQIYDPPNFSQIAKAIRAKAPSILKSWGLVPRFKRWRLSKDPETGMIVLFGILNNKYIANHTLISFSNYFDLHLLHDLANQLQVQVVSGTSDGPGYAFVLSRGQIDLLPTQLDTSFLDKNRHFPIFYNDWSGLEAIRLVSINGRIELTNLKAASIINYKVQA